MGSTLICRKLEKWFNQLKQGCGPTVGSDMGTPYMGPIDLLQVEVFFLVFLEAIGTRLEVTRVGQVDNRDAKRASSFGNVSGGGRICGVPCGFPLSQAEKGSVSTSHPMVAFLWFP